jgi:hypothetical protein
MYGLATNTQNVAEITAFIVEKEIEHENVNRHRHPRILGRFISSEQTPGHRWNGSVLSSVVYNLNECRAASNSVALHVYLIEHPINHPSRLDQGVALWRSISSLATQ